MRGRDLRATRLATLEVDDSAGWGPVDPGPPLSVAPSRRYVVIDDSAGPSGGCYARQPCPGTNSPPGWSRDLDGAAWFTSERNAEDFADRILRWSEGEARRRIERRAPAGLPPLPSPAVFEIGP